MYHNYLITKSLCSNIKALLVFIQIQPEFIAVFTDIFAQLQHLNPFQTWFAFKNTTAICFNKATAELDCHLQLYT